MDLVRRLADWLFRHHSEGGRHLELDGIRGWAALSVLICHVRYSALKDYPGTSLFFHTFAQAATSVNVFFVLSGDALSARVISRNTFSPLTVLKRIFRLSGTVTIGLLVLYILKSFDLVCEKGDPPIEGLDVGFACTWGVAIESNLAAYIWNAWVGIYTSDGILDEFLWTMSAELRGSVLVFAICSVLPRMRHRLPILFALTVYVAKYFEYLMGFFVFGVLLGQLRAQGIFETLHAHKWTRVIAGLAVLAIPLVGMYPQYFQSLTNVNLFDLVKYNSSHFAMVVVFLLYSSKDAVAFMRNPISQFLGQISFCLYVTHHHVMASVLHWLASSVPELSPFAKDWISAVTCIAAIALAYGCSLVESRYLRLLDRTAKIFLKPPSSPPEYEPVKVTELVKIRM